MPRTLQKLAGFKEKAGTDYAGSTGHEAVESEILAGRARWDGVDDAAPTSPYNRQKLFNEQARAQADGNVWGSTTGPPTGGSGGVTAAAPDAPIEAPYRPPGVPGSGSTSPGAPATGGAPADSGGGPASLAGLQQATAAPALDAQAPTGLHQPGQPPSWYRPGLGSRQPPNRSAVLQGLRY